MIESFLNMEDIIKVKDLQSALEKTQAELAILYEISNAMRTTLKLDEILYIILTGVTSHTGLGFNRAILFLVNKRDSTLDGSIAIGPDTGEEADRIWKQIETEKMTLEDLIEAYKKSKNILDSQLNRIVRNIKIALKEDAGIIVLTALEGMPIHINKNNMPDKFVNNHVLSILKTEEAAIVPLKAKDKVVGVILVDNIFTHKPITKDDIRMLTMFANQAGLAIENSRLYEQAVIQAHTDSLTRIWNHGYFQYLLGEEIKKAKELNLPLSLLMVDMDNFKNYNDALGHQKGDEILSRIADILKDTSRKQDSVCRYGGEEFAIILPQTDKKSAYLIAERMRENVERYPFFQEEIQLQHKLTISLGIATFPEDAQTKDELIAASDKTLYSAKESGKNRTCLY